ncbi:MAG: TiaS agmantine-binding domain-containing protein [Thermoplasmata archaeon]
MWIGIDDTDGPQGMCTTYLAIKIAENTQYDLIGLPRLVRLNPNIPWKTRGNAAISIRIGKGKGEKIKIGNVKGKDIFAYSHIREEPDPESILDYVSGIVEKYALFNVEKTSPGIVVTEKKISEKLYWMAVRDVLSLDDIEIFLKKSHYRGYKRKLGLIGAASAISWRPKKFTLELLTYLSEDKWGQERFVDEKSVIEMDKRIKTTFENYDYLNRKIMIKPETLTPVLYGIRGTDFHDLENAMKIVRSDHFDSYIIFKTNQGTDDHIIKGKISNIKEYRSYRIKGEVIEKPRRILGGHVLFRISDSTGIINAAAYDHTLQFREIIEKLESGDKIVIYGSVKKYNDTLNIEKIRILSLSEKYEYENPKCPICKKSMESAGRGKGFRCRRCGTYYPEKIKIRIERDIKPEYYQVPEIARRHLSMPVEFIGKNINDSSIPVP